MMARGLFALHSRYGRRPFENAVAPAEQLARLGFAPSRALLQDLRAVSGPLIADPNSRNVFAPGGRLLVEGGQLLQPDLGGTLARLRTAGVGDLYQGNMARQLEAASRTAGGPLLAADLRGALPRVAAPLLARAARDQVAFLPLPADGGLAADAAFGALQSGNAGNAGAIALGAASRARAGGSDAAAILASPAAGSLPPLPASTSFAVMDREGSAVACAVTMGNLFGTGRTVPGMGMLLAASPATTPPPLLASAIVWNPNTHGFRAAVGASGQNGAALAAATALANALATGQPMSQPVPDPGRANVITCSRYHDSEDSCAWATDPRGNGLAVGAN